MSCRHSEHPYHGVDTYPSASQIDFYASALVATTILASFHLRPLYYGVLLPSTPEAAYVLRDGQVVPLVDVPAQSLTRKVSKLSKCPSLRVTNT